MCWVMAARDFGRFFLIFITCSIGTVSVDNRNRGENPI